MAHIDILMPLESTESLPVVRTLRIGDLREVLKKGKDDFWAMPTHVIFLCMIYPLAGLLLAGATFDVDFISHLYPLAAGFVLVGPLAAIGLYELSRRRELGLDTSWRHAFDIIHSPSFGAIVKLSLFLLLLFVLWIGSAHAIYTSHFGYRRFSSVSEFANLVLTTDQGFRMILVGNLVGFAFAVVAGMLTVISFPLLLDRHVGITVAVSTSVRVVLKNPVVMAAWGLIVAVALLIGSIPLFVGLAIVVPILGHSTWHLYRKAVEPDNHPRPEYHPRTRGKRYAAEFPASLFASSTDDADRR